MNTDKGCRYGRTYRRLLYVGGIIAALMDIGLTQLHLYYQWKITWFLAGLNVLFVAYVWFVNRKYGQKSDKP